MTPANSTPAHRERTPAVVVGGGVIGLAVAFELASRGLRAKVVDPGRVPGQATWASGGMLAPLGEAQHPGPFLQFGLRSLALYPEFAGAVERASGVDPGLHLNGKLLAAMTEADEARLRERQAWLQVDGHPVTWLPGPALRDRVPAVSPDARGALLLEGNGRVNSRALLEGLRRGADSLGVERVHGRVEEIVAGGDAVRGVLLRSGEVLPASTVVVAAGAWSGQIRSPGTDAGGDVRPVKGEMLAFSAPRHLLDHVITSPRVYLIPRDTPEGSVILAGATEEDAGFDVSLSRSGQEALERAAVELVPDLADAPVIERWSGLRPGTSDRMPLIGPHPDLKGLHLATGHFRNGILLAPATARLVADQVTAGSGPAGVEGGQPAAHGGLSFEEFDPTRLVS